MARPPISSWSTSRDRSLPSSTSALGQPTCMAAADLFLGRDGSTMLPHRVYRQRASGAAASDVCYQRPGRESGALAFDTGTTAVHLNRDAEFWILHSGSDVILPSS